MDRKLKSELNNLWIDKILPEERKNDASSFLSRDIESYLIIYEKIHERNFTGDKAEYKKILRSLNSNIQSGLAEEEKNSVFHYTIFLDIQKIRSVGEDVKHNFANNPAETAKVFEILEKGKYFDGKNEVSMTREEKFRLAFFLEEVFYYRLENQGLVSIMFKGDDLSSVKSISPTKQFGSKDEYERACKNILRIYDKAFEPGAFEGRGFDF